MPNATRRTRFEHTPLLNQGHNTDRSVRLSSRPGPAGPKLVRAAVQPPTPSVPSHATHPVPRQSVARGSPGTKLVENPHGTPKLVCGSVTIVSSDRKLNRTSHDSRCRAARARLVVFQVRA